MQMYINKKYIILLSVILLVVAGNLIHGSLTRPHMRIIIRFQEVPPVIQSFPRTKVQVYYRGLNVGRVAKIDLSEDRKYILFYADIYYKNLKLPKNIQVSLNAQDMYGARNFSLNDPKNPSSQDLSDGDIICGTGIDYRIDEYLIREMSSGRLCRILSDVAFITASLRKVAETNNTDKMLSDMKNSGTDIQLVLKSLREIIDDPEVKNSLKSTIKSSSISMKEINGILENKSFKQTASQAPELINKTVKNLDSINKNIPKIYENLSQTNQALPQVNKTVSTTNCLLQTTNSNLETINSKVPPIPQELLTNADRALQKGNCLMDDLSKLLGTKFLIPKFIFGTPSESIGTCGSCKCK